LAEKLSLRRGESSCWRRGASCEIDCLIGGRQAPLGRDAVSRSEPHGNL